MSEIIAFQDVSKNYAGHCVIDKVSFVIEASSITTLVGPNGAGKTTIARLLLGIDKPTSGSITYTTKNYAYIPQKVTFNCNMPLDVKSLVKYLAGKNSSNIAKVAHFAELDRLADVQISTLSGGQLQRVFLASAMLGSPDLIVLDEPTQGLDVAGQEEFYLLLEELRKSYGVAIFMISHDMHTVMQNSDKVLCLNRHLCCSGKPENIHTSTLSQIGSYKHH
ncbi:MAG: metal ABC transporter ATP-binding protein, partial [Pseudomonadota bacterium]